MKKNIAVVFFSFFLLSCTTTTKPPIQETVLKQDYLFQKGNLNIDKDCFHLIFNNFLDQEEFRLLSSDESAGTYKSEGKIIALIKPQFEANKNEIKKGGVVVNPVIHQRICLEIRNWFRDECNLKVKGIIQSPLRGPKGNIEFLILAQK